MHHLSNRRPGAEPGSRPQTAATISRPNRIPRSPRCDGFWIGTGIHKIITRPRMVKAWTQVNRVAHQALVAALSGRGGRNGAIGVSNGQVTLDIAPLEAVAKRIWPRAG